MCAAPRMRAAPVQYRRGEVAAAPQCIVHRLYSSPGALPQGSLSIEGRQGACSCGGLSKLCKGRPSPCTVRPLQGADLLYSAIVLGPLTA